VYVLVASLKDASIAILLRGWIHACRPWKSYISHCTHKP